MSSKKENIAIFEDTRAMCKDNSVLGISISYSESFQYVYTGPAPQGPPEPRFAEPAKIIVSPKRSLEAARAYSGKGVCVLNSGSATTPGNGVNWGAFAQEESLCRCSTLYENLNSKDCWSVFYGPHRKTNNPLNNDDIIYTPDVMVFKSDTEAPALLDQDQWFTCSVITCSPPDLRSNHNTGARVKISNERLKVLHIKRLRNILSIAAGHEHDAIILGAFGCGMFRNPPEVVAAAMKEVVDEFRYCFRTIEFAMHLTPRDAKNYEVFSRVLDMGK